MAETVKISPAAEEPSAEAIRRLAHSCREARGREGGSAQEDWLAAEREPSRVML